MTEKYYFLCGSIFLILFLYIFFMIFLVIISKNPINTIIFLILFFFGIAALLIFIGADYLGALFLMIYAGAISILFLFVIMFLDFKKIYLKNEKKNKFFLTLIVFTFFFTFSKLSYTFKKSIENYIPRASYTDWFEIFNLRTNIENIGLILYENFHFQVIILALLLFLIMVMIISLIINYNKSTKKQILFLQIKKKNYVIQKKA